MIDATVAGPSDTLGPDALTADDVVDAEHPGVLHHGPGHPILVGERVEENVGGIPVGVLAIGGRARDLFADVGPRVAGL